jgi:membrane dipeptidase
MRRSLALVVLLAAALPLAAQNDPLAARVERVLSEVPLIDGHNDLPWQMRARAQDHLAQIDLRADQSKLIPPMHTDIARLHKGHLGAQFWSVYVPVTLAGSDAVVATFEQIDVVHRLAASYPDTLELALTADDIVRIHHAGKVASLIGIEGGHSIGDSLAVLREMYRAGARYMTITHTSNNHWADSATDAPVHNGLSPFGRIVIGEMNRLGMLVDLSHVSAKTMNDVLDISAAPPIFSHSSARALTDHSRNVPDDVLQRLLKTDGVVMVTWVPTFVSEAVRGHYLDQVAEEARLKEKYLGRPDDVKRELDAWKAAHVGPRATIANVADHIDHVKQVAGIDHIGVGADLDGITSTPEGLESTADYPALFRELARRGYSDEELKKIAGLNVLRVMRKAEAVAAKLQKERQPADDRIEPLKKEE